MANKRLYFLNHCSQVLYIGLVPDGDDLRIVITNEVAPLFADMYADPDTELVTLIARTEQLIHIDLVGPLGCGLRDGKLNFDIRVRFSDGRRGMMTLGGMRRDDGPVFEISPPQPQN